MKRIQEVIVVEGKTDTATLQQLFDVDTIETSGSGINEAILQQIETAAKTDPDYPGQQIRNKIIARVPNAKHAFVKKKDAIGKKKLGIAEARHEAIIEALENTVQFREREDTLSWQDFISLDIIGDHEKRDYLYHTYRLGHGNNKALFKRLNMIGVTKRDIEEKLQSYSK
ncbi:ribonuclease M5 [Sharpea azabuensis]|uniref:ribonuclease M5 n=1 Tax=Sharpea azabuensis TaxID=322505 RepID=UPI001568EB3A|nr:ribonuclease M5 [Sharpea azabuensis]